ncbi:hypothetical protein [Neorhodopirellula lusitana]|uniref:hypothetical protein n=1 Tax=Neorhodopirellula lusitana TaxID=445327 RepID=UPI0024B78236|nr:hypothetical protein [Neorhodopirellula lusitana]
MFDERWPSPGGGRKAGKDGRVTYATAPVHGMVIQLKTGKLSQDEFQVVGNPHGTEQSQVLRQ